MKTKLIIALMITIVLSCVGCAKSALDKVEIKNVEKESYRPVGYVPSGGIDGFEWDGVVISGDITNTSNESLTVAVVIHSYGNKNKNSRYHETEEIRLDPGETEQFEYKFVYDDQNVMRPFGWYHDISDVIYK